MAGTSPQKELAPSNASLSSTPSSEPVIKDGSKAKTTFFACIMGSIASLGGLMLGYESGQISGFLAMNDFRQRFGENGNFGATRAGTIVGILCIGTLIGCLCAGWVCERLGRRLTILFSALFYICAVVIEVTSMTRWEQFAVGRFAAGLGIGALSTAVPMYQSESVPATIRGVVVSSYQLLITIGILAAYIANFATNIQYTNSLSWRIPNAISAVWAGLLAIGIFYLPESPRYAYRRGKHEQARNVMARLNGVEPDCDFINAELATLDTQLASEAAVTKGSFWEIFTGPRMSYRTLLGMALMAGQQLTGANFFFYFGTTIFANTGISNGFVVSLILGGVNVGATIVALFFIEKVGRRKALTYGALWQFVCFMVYSLTGSLTNPVTNHAAGSVLIVFTCLFICSFAATWGPLVWVVVSELYPPQHRSKCAALATASNWLFNFAISFTTTFIVAQIKYWYGLVFACSSLGLACLVFFFVIEGKGRTLEEIDHMYVNHVSPRKSANWKATGNAEMTEA